MGGYSWCYTKWILLLLPVPLLGSLLSFIPIQRYIPTALRDIAGLFGYYNVCYDYAYSYYMSSGEGARLTYPIVDISATNISKVTLYMDVLHKGADNYQDRYEFVARAGNDPSDLGDYARSPELHCSRTVQLTVLILVSNWVATSLLLHSKISLLTHRMMLEWTSLVVSWLLSMT